MPGCSHPPVMRVTQFVVSLITLAAIAASSAAEPPKVTVVLGSLLPAEGGPAQRKASELKSPFGIDFNRHGDMFVVELEGGRVHTRTVTGVLRTTSGNGQSGFSGDGGPARDAVFNGIHNVAVTPEGDVFIADSWSHCIRKIDPAGTISTVAGTGEPGFSGDGGPANAARFDFVMCITLNLTNDKLFIADLRNRRIRKFDLSSGIVTTVAGNGEQGVPRDGAAAVESPLTDPRAVATDSHDRVYILERGGHALRVVQPDGRLYTVAGTGQAGHRDGSALTAQFNSPKHLCVDDDDNVFIADDQNNAIRKFDAVQKTVATVLGQGKGTRAIRLSRPHGVCWERGKLYVVDTGHDRVLRVDEF